MKEKASVIIDVLNKVKCAVAKAPTLRQSDCVIFQSGKCFAFSGDLFAITSFDPGFEGAVNFETFSNILSHYADNQVNLVKSDEVLTISMGRSRSKVACASTIYLAISAIAKPDPNNWVPLDADWVKAFRYADAVAVPSNADNVLGSVHIDLDKIEAASTNEIIRIGVTSPFSKRFLVRSGILKSLPLEGLTEVQISGNWLFLRNAVVTYATPIYDDAYLDIDPYLQPDSNIVTFDPKLLQEEVARCCAVLKKGELLNVDLDATNNVCTISANGINGSHSAEVDMTCPITTSFQISPTLFTRVITEFGSCSISMSGVRVNNPGFAYAATII